MQGCNPARSRTCVLLYPRLPPCVLQVGANDLPRKLWTAPVAVLVSYAPPATEEAPAEAGGEEAGGEAEGGEATGGALVGGEAAGGEAAGGASVGGEAAGGEAAGGGAAAAAGGEAAAAVSVCKYANLAALEAYGLKGDDYAQLVGKLVGLL